MVKHHHECGMSVDGTICTCPRGWPKDENGKELDYDPEDLEKAVGVTDEDIDMVDDIIQDIYDARMPMAKRLAMLGVHHRPAKPMNGYLPFPRAPMYSGQPGNRGPSWTISACPQLLFRPEALILWGYDAETMITMVTLGNQIQGAATAGELPASFFGTARTYEKILEDLKVNGISTPSWLTFPTLHVGQVASISGYGILRNAVMLGKMIY